MEQVVLHFRFRNSNGPHHLESPEQKAPRGKVYYPNAYLMKNQDIKQGMICLCSIVHSAPKLANRFNSWYEIHYVNLEKILVTSEQLRYREKQVKELKRAWGGSYPSGFQVKENEYILGVIALEDLDLLVRATP